jgi:Flp pilus assembly protein TadG
VNRQRDSRSLAARNAERQGAAMVEMALVLPVFLMVALGIIEFGRAMMVSNMVTNAAREGARTAVVDGSTNSEVQQVVVDFLVSSLAINSSDVTVTITITPATGNPEPANQCSASHTRDVIQLEVRVPYSAVAMIPADYLEGVQLVGRSAMRHE